MGLRAAGWADKIHRHRAVHDPAHLRRRFGLVGDSGATEWKAFLHSVSNDAGHEELVERTLEWHEHRPTLSASRLIAPTSKCREDSYVRIEARGPQESRSTPLVPSRGSGGATNHSGLLRRKSCISAEHTMSESPKLFLDHGSSFSG